MEGSSIMKTKHFRGLAVGFVGLISVVALLPSSAKAECAQWSASGNWSLVQGAGKGTAVHFSLTQTGSMVTGGANYEFKANTSDGVDKRNGSVDGTIEGNK